MPTFLHIDSSVQPDSSRSLTKRLSRAVIDAVLARAPESLIISRDIGANPPPLISSEWVTAAFTAEAERTTTQQAVLAHSEVLIEELKAADVIVLGAPMYNYGMPGPLKAWFDAVIRLDKTFTFDLARGDAPLAPVLTNKTLVLLTSNGEFGFEPGGINAHKNHLAPHIRTCAHYLGVERMLQLGIDYQEFRDDRHAASVEAAFNAIPALADTLLLATSPRPAHAST
ncbi:FMN-dependent NADH-azoreductase [Larsenimonas suaedae]|uniref:FMN dependent NADH:quinone oxidoreductase n=1 Tax=Larsenimonas suaedae TaxID=1851019 RepID=A0ABU1GT85_9GAMM|nr:NAD(P)H-dependent oxidoreductase [Larsenimonas suaedae]MCM2972591.1 NAD(P)H-dependent oxidoreductase [Larsenimonas suaedae]MDR5894613.1 NAD(P)H-dependent oxidoreductase [Larsenimonas suaedae]